VDELEEFVGPVKSNPESDPPEPELELEPDEVSS